MATVVVYLQSSCFMMAFMASTWQSLMLVQCSIYPQPCDVQESRTVTEQIAALKSSPAPLEAAQRKTAELEDDKAKFHTHIGSLEVCPA